MCVCYKLKNTFIQGFYAPYYQATFPGAFYTIFIDIDKVQILTLKPFYRLC
ncbi:hypothetical protein CEDIAZO_01194 [Celerinatantimonas diazotrophica]|nr:hypothetical protein CEDIAZO_01194 [Celerinatantimonas diazotrophica]